MFTASSPKHIGLQNPIICQIHNPKKNLLTCGAGTELRNIPTLVVGRKPNLFKRGVMKIGIKKLSLVIMAGLGLVLADSAAAQIFTTLHAFTAVDFNAGTNYDGANPSSKLILSSNILYGVTQDGGTNGNGTVFAINIDGTGFTILHSFTAGDGSFPNFTNADGAAPTGLTLSGGTLYGISYGGGTNGSGTVFAVSTNGAGFTVLHTFAAGSGSFPNFTNSDGANPVTGLILSGSTLYGTATQGGTNASGTVFAVNTNGTGFTMLHAFAPLDQTYGTNIEGAYPYNGLILSDSTLYGTASQGGTNGSGTVFSVNTDGTGFAVLHTFKKLEFQLDSNFGTNSDGISPDGLILSGGTLYGTAAGGGTNGTGTVFAINTNSAALIVLHTFAASDGYFTNFTENITITNDDGANPYAGLILSGNTLYGITFAGGTNSSGTMFAMSTNGTAFTVLHTFESLDSNTSTNADGAFSAAELTLSGNTLYGTAFDGGINGNGTLFSLSYPSPQLSIMPSGTNVYVSWPSDMAGFSYSGYTLQSSTNLAPSANWSDVLIAPVVTNTNNVVTDFISGPQMFYRLSQ
jgi:uncharacterized repeat protein (TIGR03803 family)